MAVDDSDGPIVTLAFGMIAPLGSITVTVSWRRASIGPRSGWTTPGRTLLLLSKHFAD